MNLPSTAYTDEKEAIAWINQSLSARWDDRPTLAGTSIFTRGTNPNFAHFGTSEAFQRAAGSYLDTTLSRDETWRQDLRFLVGEPSGSRPNALSESGWFNLPHSRLTGIVSSQFHQSGEPEDHRIWVAPHMPIGVSSDEYFSGEDPPMDAIFKFIGDASSLER